MRFARALGASITLFATAAVAAPGDRLVVTGDVVNVRTGPGARHSVLMHASRDEEAVELGRTGDWVQVQLPGAAIDGWIHQSLLQPIRAAPPAGPAPPAPKSPSSAGPPPAPTAAVSPVRGGDATPPSEALARFRSHVDELNARAVAVAGVELFSGAESAADGTVQVMVTDAWNLVPAAGQTSYTNALFDRWRAAAGGAGELRLQVVDPSGMVVSEKSGPGMF